MMPEPALFGGGGGGGVCVCVWGGGNWEQFRSAQFLSQLAPRSVELGAGPNWEQLVQMALRPALSDTT